MDVHDIGPTEITEWLDSQSDFTLEMKVSSHTASLGLETEHGGTYSDPVTDKPRQFDVRCVGRNNDRAIKLAVECKALSKQFPLVIQRVPRTGAESFHDVFVISKPIPGSVQHVLPSESSAILRPEPDSPLYPVGALVGKGCNQIGKKNDKLYANDRDVYEKWSQAIASADDLISNSVAEREKLGLSQTLTVVFPVLVVSDDCLWCVDYDSTGDRISDPARASEVEFYISKEYWRIGQMHASYTVSHLKIVTLAGYEHFSRKLASNVKYWDDVFPMENLAEQR